MKSFYATLALVLLLSGFGNAQAAPIANDASVEAQAKEQTRLMGSYIHFNEYEYICIRKINQLHLLEVQNAKQDFASAPEVLTKKLEELQVQYDAAVAKVLNAKQQAAYAAFKKQHVELALSAGK